MQKKTLRFGRGFRVVFGNRRAQAAEMVIAPGDSEGSPTPADVRQARRERRPVTTGNRHRGADQWLFVVAGTGVAIVAGRRHPLRAGTLVLIERGEKHEIRNTGRTLLRTLNVYVPPAYRRDETELPAGKR